MKTCERCEIAALAMRVLFASLIAAILFFAAADRVRRIDDEEARKNTASVSGVIRDVAFDEEHGSTVVEFEDGTVIRFNELVGFPLRRGGVTRITYDRRSMFVSKVEEAGDGKAEEREWD